MDKNEDWAYVYYDFFLDFLFFCDMLIRFNTPIYSEGRLITDRKKIARTYFKSWFFFDLFCILPMSWLRKRSEHWPRGSNDLENFININWNALPRLYPMVMLPKMLIRMRSINGNMIKVLKRASFLQV